MSVITYHCVVPQLETERLMMRGFLARDLGPLVGMCADEETMRYLGGPRQHVDVAQRHASMVGHWVLKGYGMWAVIEKASGDFVGRVGLIDFEGWPQLEVGWLIGRDWWGRGYAPEAARAAAHWAFQNLECKELCSLIHPDNQSSARVAEKIGERPGELIPFADGEVVIHRVARDAFYQHNTEWYQDVRSA